jgi:TRAP-type C4-dicarboxylate transport system substrate-binding protein
MKLLASLCFGLCAACLSFSHQASAQQTLRFNSFAPPQELLNRTIFPAFAKNVTADSGGTAKVDYFPGGGLGRNPRAQLKLVIDGVADIAFVLPAFTPGRFPDNDIIQLPGLIRSGAEGSVLIWRLHQKGMLRGYEKIKVLALATTPPYAIHTRFPMKSMDDLKGRKLRSGGRIHGEMLKKLGGTPVGIPTPSVAESISKGVIDGTMHGFHAARAFRILDVTDHHYIHPLGTLSLMVAMNKQSYAKLPAAGKAAIQKHMGEAFSKAMGAMPDQSAAQALAKMQGDPKHTVTFAPAAEKRRWNEVLEPLINDWKKNHPKGEMLWKAASEELAVLRAGK